MWYIRYSAIALILATSLPGFCNDQQKADKQLRKVTAMCADAMARSVVSRTMADMLAEKREQLVRQRRNLNLNYGSLFLAHELMASGMSIADVAAGLRAGKSVYQIADEKHADWKAIAANAKKLNSRVDDNIYKHYLNSKNTELDEGRDLADHYNAEADWVQADHEVSAPEVAEAEANFVFWRKLAGQNNVYKGLTTAEEKAASFDPVKASHGNGAADAPAAGGIPPK
jgi:hypothetical protein